MSDYEEYDEDEDAFEAVMLERGWAEHEVIANTPLGMSPDVVGAVRLEGVGRYGSAVLRSETVDRLRIFVVEELDRCLAEARATGDGDDVFSSVLCAGEVGADATRYDLRLPLEAEAVCRALGELVETIGPDVDALATGDAELWELAAFVSLRGAPPQPLHADTLFSPQPCLLTTLVALQDIDVASMGPTRFVLGTHADEASHDAFDRDGSVRFLLNRADRTRAALLDKGHAAMYDGRCFHSGGANSHKARLIFYCTFRHPNADADALSNLDAHSILPELAQRKLTLNDLRRGGALAAPSSPR